MIHLYSYLCFHTKGPLPLPKVRVCRALGKLTLSRLWLNTCGNAKLVSECQIARSSPWSSCPGCCSQAQMTFLRLAPVTLLKTQVMSASSVTHCCSNEQSDFRYIWPAINIAIQPFLVAATWAATCAQRAVLSMESQLKLSPWMFLRHKLMVFPDITNTTLQRLANASCKVDLVTWINKPRPLPPLARSPLDERGWSSVSDLRLLVLRRDLWCFATCKRCEPKLLWDTLSEHWCNADTQKTWWWWWRWWWTCLW